MNPCVYLHSDSQITLAWLKTEPQQLTVYVSNRVKTIQEETQGFSWFYVNSHENPADALSRGVEPHLLETNELWWRGPGFLYCKEFPNNRDNFTMPTDIPETKVCLAVDKAEKQEKLEVFSKFSSLNKLIRVMGYVYRFINICRKKAKRNAGRLSCQEVDASLKMIIKYDQQQHFKEEIAGLSLGKEIAAHLKALNPFVDGMGLMRVGGRLQHADLPYYQKHPIILAKKSNITHLIIENEHKTLMHAGQKLMYASLSQRYHIVNGLREIKHVVHKCLITGATLSTVPEPNISNIPINRLKFWKQCSHMTQCFWKSWSREYLMQLQSRPKWRKPLPNISKGMLVILRKDNAPPLVWPMARVVETFPGADGKVRALTVITPKGTVMRTSIGKVCLLPIEDNQNQI
ncbi:uncharacterized protein LOC119690573 [Plutella xylostella]|uniref:uncharacterized protein LOC119690573 n=1 Tax=Plutella xylostella TaxID=51655 RepID=UPI0020324676|nr:uncharacterized protein LOC119690573 [Plutella xylostella]